MLSSLLPAALNNLSLFFLMYFLESVYSYLSTALNTGKSSSTPYFLET